MIILSKITKDIIILTTKDFMNLKENAKDFINLTKNAKSFIILMKCAKDFIF